MYEPLCEANEKRRSGNERKLDIIERGGIVHWAVQYGSWLVRPKERLNGAAVCLGTDEC